MTDPVSGPPAVRSAADLAAGALAAVRPEHLTARTPCADFDVRALLDHLAWAALISQRAATRMPLDPPAPGRPAPFLDGLLPEQWAAAIAPELDAAADAWADPAAWQGDTVLGGATVPAAVVGPLMLTEFVVHGWDLATAVGAPLFLSATLAPVTLAAVEQVAPMGRDGGWYGPAVPVPEDANPLDRALALTGRDPDWTG
ncbi:TIGR03086 family metal-binding protein [Modestobacter roseus]|uniref:TIGR03086 family metal-binding protein n=1 Tax=Modestobacter roseus TaxID=1181884 RepID=UPI0034DE0E98